ncbi:MAG: NAD(P)/FAD-dependent oxidoreductase [Desulfobacterales bacterium]
MNNYDVVVIGTGTAGQSAAYELKANGMTVAVVEKSTTPGGTCALAGCQAKKWFYEAAEISAKANHLQGKGIVATPQISWADLLKEKNKFTGAVPSSTLSGFKSGGIDVITGTARFLDDHRLNVDGRTISARFFVIAAGARPLALPIDGIENLITSNQFLELPSLPRRFVFIGGGFIAFEFAHFVARLGAGDSRKTTILEVAPRPLGPFDAEMVSLLVAASKAEGIDIYTGVNVTAVERQGNAFKVLTEDGRAYEADTVVNGAGRQADIEELDLQLAGIDFSRRGITVNTQMQTTQPHIYAVGDCAATIQLARVADEEAMVAAESILGRQNSGKRPAMDYSTVPSLLFTYPQCGMVGATEEDLTAEGVSYRRSFGQHLTWPTYRRIGMTHAAYKILAGEDGNLLGAHILSDNAAGIINTVRLAMLNKIPVETLYRQCMMSPYPSRESDMLYMLKPLL